MFGQVIAIAFWTLFAAAALPAAVFLLGTILRSGQLATGRAYVDDGSDDPESVGYRAYALARDSDVLMAAAILVAMPLVASVVSAAIGTSVLADLGGLAIVCASSFAAKAIRLRHERLERRFLALTGLTVADASARVLERRPLPLPIDDRPASSA